MRKEQQTLRILGDKVRYYRKLKGLSQADAIAADNLSKIRFEKIKNEDDQKRYYYYQGIVELFKNNAPDESIYFFGRVLSPLVNSERDLYGILATLGLGLAYADKHTFDRSRVYIDQALRMLKHVPLSDSILPAFTMS